MDIITPSVDEIKYQLLKRDYLSHFDSSRNCTNIDNKDNKIKYNMNSQMSFIEGY